MIIPTDEPKTSAWFNCVAFLAFIAFIFHTLIVIMYLLYFLGIWETVSSDPGSWYHDGDYPLYFSLWFIEIIILWTWFHYTLKEAPEEEAKRKKLISTAVQNVIERLLVPIASKLNAQRHVCGEFLGELNEFARAALPHLREDPADRLAHAFALPFGAFPAGFGEVHVHHTAIVGVGFACDLAFFLQRGQQCGHASGGGFH